MATADQTYEKNLPFLLSPACFYPSIVNKMTPDGKAACYSS